MTASLCPNGHRSTTSDWCDTCGAPIGAAPNSVTRPPPTTTVPPLPAAGVTCPHCSAENVGDALFCEECGYDFTTGQAPPDPPRATAVAAPHAVAVPTTGWTAELSADRSWYDLKQNDDTDPFPTDQAPIEVALGGDTVLIGRVSESRGIHPEIDAGADSAVSRRHAQLVGSGDGWQVVDLDSTNGTAVHRRGEPLPETSAIGGPPVPIGDGDSVLVGAWTRITLRHLDGPQAAVSNETVQKVETP